MKKRNKLYLLPTPQNKKYLENLNECVEGTWKMNTKSYIALPYKQTEVEIIFKRFNVLNYTICDKTKKR